MLPRLLFRDDIFISYARADGAAYATGLADQLTAKGFSCFLDRLGTEPDHKLPRSLRQRIRSCTMAVVVGTERCAASTFVEQEIAEFLKTKRVLLPIDFAGAVGRACWYRLLPGLPAEEEKSPDAREQGEPSPNVIGRIEKSFRYTRRNQHMLRVFWMTSALFVIVIAAGLAATRWFAAKAEQGKQAADKASAAAHAATIEAGVQQTAADAARGDAKAQTEAARQASLEARRQQELAARSATTARERLIDLSQEQGRLELLRSNREQGLVYLSDAYAQRPRDEALQFLVAVAKRSLVRSFRGAPEKSRFREEALSGEVDVSDGFGLALSHAAFSRDGSRIVTATIEDMSVWDARSGQLLQRLRANEDENERATFVAFVDDDTHILSRSIATVKLWDAKTGRLLRVLPELQETAEIAWLGDDTQLSPDQKRLLIPGDKARVYEIASGRLVYELESHNDAAPIEGRDAASFSPDGKLIVTIYRSSTLSLWSAEDGHLLFTPIPAGKEVRVATFSPDGKVVVTADDSNVVKVWDTASGTLLYTLEGHRGPVHAAIFDEQGSYLATGSTDRTIRIWDPQAKFAAVRTLEGHRSEVKRLAFGRHGHRLIAICNAPREPDARVWDVEQGLLLDTLPGQMTAVVVSPDGEHLLTTNPNDEVRIWSFRNDLLVDAGISVPERESQSYEAGREPVTTAFSPDGRYLAAASDEGQVQVWDTRCRCVVRSYSANAGVTLPASAFHPDSRQLAIPFFDGVRIVDVESGRVGPPLCTGFISAAFSHDGKQLVLVSVWGTTAETWDVKKRTSIHQLRPKLGLQTAEFSADDQVIIGAEVSGRGGRIWNASTGVPVADFYGERPEFSTDGSRIATASVAPRTGRLFNATLTDAHTGAFIANFDHDSSVTSATFSRDGQRLVTTEHDGVARVWDVVKRQRLLSLGEHGGAATCAAFSPGRGRIVTGDEKGIIRIWDAMRGQLLFKFPAHGTAIRSVSFSADGSLLVSVGQAPGRGLVKLWDVHLERETPGTVMELATRWISPDVIRTVVRQQGPAGLPVLH